jgi:hypothetical protein
MRGVHPLLVRWTCYRYKRFLSCLGCSSRPSTKYVFPHRTLFQFFVPIRLGRQPCGIACLLVCVSGTHLTPTFFAAANYKHATYSPFFSVQKNNRCQCWPFVRHFFTFKIRIRNGRGGGSPIYFLASKHTHFFGGGGGGG